MENESPAERGVDERFNSAAGGRIVTQNPNLLAELTGVSHPVQNQTAPDETQREVSQSPPPHIKSSERQDSRHSSRRSEYYQADEYSAHQEEADVTPQVDPSYNETYQDDSLQDDGDFQTQRTDQIDDQDNQEDYTDRTNQQQVGGSRPASRNTDTDSDHEPQPVSPDYREPSARSVLKSRNQSSTEYRGSARSVAKSRSQSKAENRESSSRHSSVSNRNPEEIVDTQRFDQETDFPERSGAQSTSARSKDPRTSSRGPSRSSRASRRSGRPQREPSKSPTGIPVAAPRSQNTSAKNSSAPGTSQSSMSKKKVYIEPEDLVHDDTDQYRFVSSRIDEYDDPNVEDSLEGLETMQARAGRFKPQSQYVLKDQRRSVGRQDSDADELDRERRYQEDLEKRLNSSINASRNFDVPEARPRERASPPLEQHSRRSPVYRDSLDDWNGPPKPPALNSSTGQPQRQDETPRESQHLMNQREYVQMGVAPQTMPQQSPRTNFAMQDQQQYGGQQQNFPNQHQDFANQQQQNFNQQQLLNQQQQFLNQQQAFPSQNQFPNQQLQFLNQQQQQFPIQQQHQFSNQQQFANFQQIPNQQQPLPVYQQPFNQQNLSPRSQEQGNFQQPFAQNNQQVFLPNQGYQQNQSSSSFQPGNFVAQPNTFANQHLQQQPVFNQQQVMNQSHPNVQPQGLPPAGQPGYSGEVIPNSTLNHSHQAYDPEDQYDKPDDYDQANSVSPPRSRRQRETPQQPGIDFVERNKETVNKPPPQKSYGDRFVERKSRKRTTPKRQSRKASDGRVSDTGEYINDDTEDRAEMVWKQRSMSLNRMSGSQKSRKTQNTKNLSGRQRSLPRSDDPKPPAGPQQGYQQNIPQPTYSQAPQPAYSQAAVGGTSPLSQVITTDDGQRISVDVNLRLISPPPTNNPYLQPVGPVTTQIAPQVARQNVPGVPQPRYGAWQQQQPPPQGAGQAGGAQYAERPATYLKQLPSYSAGQAQAQRPNESLEQPFSDPGDAFPSPRDKLEWTQGTPQGYDGSKVPNRYKPLPPIAKQHSAPVTTQQAGDGYAAMFRQRKDAGPVYQPYTLRDYRSMQKEVRLGSLGPDIDNDTFREKMEKRNRQVDFGREAMERNRAQLARRPQVYSQPKEDDIMNQHKLRMEYAKSLRVPKPKPQPKQPQKSDAGRRRSQEKQSPSSRGEALQTLELEMDELERLAQRHEREKQTVAAIRQGSQPVV